MAKAIRIHQPGGSEVLQIEDVEVGASGAGQARIRKTAIRTGRPICLVRCRP